jgi:hypothetical protein
VLLAKAIRISFASGVPWGEVLVNLGVVLGCAALLLACVAWRVRRSDR